MDKKYIIIGIGIIVFFSGGLYLYYTNKQNFLSPLSQKLHNSSTQSKEKLPSTQLQDYSDESGFRFQYADDLMVKKNESSDSTMFADITITSKDVSGSASIKIFQSSLQSPDQWLKENTANGEITDVTLGTFAARQIKDSNGMFTAAVDQGVLFSVRTLNQGQQAYWTTVYNTILSTFTIVTQPTGASGNSTSSSASGSDVILEDETID